MTALLAWLIGPAPTDLPPSVLDILDARRRGIVPAEVWGWIA